MHDVACYSQQPTYVDFKVVVVVMVELARVYNAIAAMNSSNKQECENAARFLEEFQKTVSSRIC